MFRPRGVLHCWATDEDDETVDERYGKVGKQKIEDTGPLNIARMPTVDEEFRDAAIDFIERQAAADTPFFVWFNATHMHLRTPSEAGEHWAGRARAVARTTTR